MPHHVVVDGSNLATEGRSMPSLQQLDEAVRAYMEVDPDALITVVVDATFGHRIDPRETEVFDAAVANNEIVAPPAGAVGRGDAFVLSIANKVNATILTNDSYQEFHGQYAWLFDEGRIIGGKPVPHIGWVFVNRTPVRGPLSRKSMAESKRRGRRTGAPVVNEVRTGSPEASLPMPVPAAPPPGAVLPRKGRERSGQHKPADTKLAAEAMSAAEVKPAVQVQAVVEARPAPKSNEVNELLAFLTFVELHPPGSSVSAVVESYSSHGAYVAIGEVRGYVPLRLMAEPAPRSARDLGKVGESVTLVVESFAAARRSIDLAVPALATAKLPEPKPAKPAKAASKRVKKAAPAVPVMEAIAAAAAAGDEAPAKPRAKRAKKAAVPAPAVPAPAVPAPAVPSPVEPSPVEPSPVEPPAKRSGRKRASAPADAEVHPPAVVDDVRPEPPAVPPAELEHEPVVPAARPRGRGRARSVTTAPPASAGSDAGAPAFDAATASAVVASVDAAPSKPVRRRKAAAAPPEPTQAPAAGSGSDSAASDSAASDSAASDSAASDSATPVAPKPARRAKKAAPAAAPEPAAAPAPAAPATPRRGRRTGG